MAVTRVGTHTERKVTSNSTELDIASHTVPSGCTFLLVFIGLEGNEAISGTPQWSLGGGENLTLIQDVNQGSTAAAETMCFWYGLVNPTAGTGTVTIAMTSNCNPAYGLAVNYDGTSTTDAISLVAIEVGEDINTAAATDTTIASGGTAGDTLVVGAIHQGADGFQATYDANWTLIDDGATGGSSTADFAHTHFDEQDVPSARSVAITWQASDENCGGMIRLVPDSGGASLSIPVAMRHYMQMGNS